MILIQQLDRKFELSVAILVGIISFATKNLSIALITGLLVEYGYGVYQKKRGFLLNGDSSYD